MSDRFEIISTIDTHAELKKVDKSLAELYRQAMSAEATGLAVPTVKTALLNLLVYACSKEAADRMVGEVAVVVGRHPSRAIIIEATSMEEGEPAGIVSVVCGITDRGDRRLCGEIIRIRASGADTQISGIIMPLLAPDVPVFVWSPCTLPLDDSRFHELVREAECVVLDSRQFTDLLRCYNWIREQVIPTRDLGWISLLPWREYIAEHFDAPATRDYLYNLHSVDVTYSKDTSSLFPSAPMLLISWLIERTGMHIETVELDNEVIKVSVRQDDSIVDIRLIPEESDIEQGSILSIILRSGEPDRLARFVVRSVSANEISADEECPGLVCLLPRIHEIGEQNESAMVSIALDSYQNDPIYEAALDVAIKLLEKYE